MSVALIEMRPIGAAPITGDDDDCDDSINENSTAFVTSSTTRTAATIAATRRHVMRKYLSMIMIAYILTLISPGTILWSSSSSLVAKSGAPCNPSSRTSPVHAPTKAMDKSSPMATTLSTNTTTFGDTPTGNEYDGKNHNNYATPNTDRNITDENSKHSDTYDNCTMMEETASTINIPLLLKLTSYTIALIGLFFYLQGSNPGLLDKDILCRLEDDALVAKKNYATPTTDNGDNCNNTCIDCGDGDEGKEDSAIERQSFLNPTSQTYAPTDGSSTQSTLHPPQHHPPMLPLTQRQQHHSSGHCYPHTRRKYCNICKIHPPIRSHHCNICHACVATFDHHCVFLGTCIGERNHFRFWFFVLWNVLCFHLALGIVSSGRVVPQFGALNDSSNALLALLGFHHDAVEASIEWDSSNILQIRRDQAILFIAKVYFYPLYGIVILLLIIHTILALGNCTTFEMTKGPGNIDYLVNTKMMDCPFGNGVFYNIRMFIMRDDIFTSRDCCWRSFKRRRLGEIEGETTSHDKDSEVVWVPTLWKMPTRILRDSEDWWNHPWQNKYWSCC
jgi:hypothetical protein